MMFHDSSFQLTALGWDACAKAFRLAGFNKGRHLNKGSLSVACLQRTSLLVQVFGSGQVSKLRCTSCGSLLIAESNCVEKALLGAVVTCNLYNFYLCLVT